MPGPFYNAIKGTTAGTPGTGAFTPNAAATGGLAWSTVPAGWIGLVRFEDGSAWELQYSYWNGTTLSRNANVGGTLNQFVASSTGSGLTLTSAATAAMVPDAAEIQPGLGSTRTSGALANLNNNSSTLFGFATVAGQGTVSAVSLSNTNYMTERVRLRYTSSTVANGAAGWSFSQFLANRSTSAGRGGFVYTSQFGFSQLPVGPKVFAGMTSSSWNGSGEPSAHTANLAVLGVDSTDSNFHLITNDASGAGGKTDTGIALAVDGWYEARVWCDPGGSEVFGRLIRMDTGQIWLGSTTTNLPTSGAMMTAHLQSSLSGTTGTAIIMEIGQVFVRNVN